MAITLINQDAESAFDRQSLLIWLLRNTVYIIILTGLIVSISYVWLLRIEPQYRAQATILIDTSESAAVGSDAAALDRELVESQARLLRSRDLSRTIAQKFDLAHRAEFDQTLHGTSPIADFLVAAGLRRDPLQSSPDERVLEQFSRNLTVSADPPVIAIAFKSADAQLAAAVPNALAEEYIVLQQAVRRAEDADGADWLASEIDGLRRRIEYVETEVEAYRARVDRLTRGPASQALTDSRGQAVLTPAARADVEADLAALEREAATQRELLESYLQRYRAALTRSQSSGLPVSARILARASVPNDANTPRPASLAAAIGLIAFTLMFAFVVLRELTAARPANRETSVPLPDVADAPPNVERQRWGDDRGVRRIMPTAPTFAGTAENNTDRSVVAAAETIAAEKIKRIMIVTVAGGFGERQPLAGVTLARAMAGDELRPVLIDLRDDAANSRCMGDNTALPGFFDLFAGEASFGQVIFRDRESRVHYIPAGLHPPTQGRIGEERMRLLVSALDHTYDHVILDVADALIETIGPVCDIVLLIGVPGESDPRNAQAIERIRAVTDARIMLLSTEAFSTADEGATSDNEAA